jgi:hypothetical protein
VGDALGEREAGVRMFVQFVPEILNEAQHPQKEDSQDRQLNVAEDKSGECDSGPFFAAPALRDLAARNVSEDDSRNAKWGYQREKTEDQARYRHFVQLRIGQARAARNPWRRGNPRRRLRSKRFRACDAIVASFRIFVRAVWAVHGSLHGERYKKAYHPSLP